MKQCLIYPAFQLFSFVGLAQPKIVAGPMLGPIELRDAKIWVEVSAEVKTVSLQYNKKGTTGSSKTIHYKGELGNDFNPIQFVAGGLDFNTTYEYRFSINGKLTATLGQFTTKDLWQYRKPVPDFSFLAGSCSFTNDPVFDRPGKPYGRDSSIFETMAREKAAFMLWLGDAWYTREVDYYSEWGLWYRAHHARAAPVMRNFLKAMPHFAIWDDHEYGPNDIGKNYILKEVSRRVFMNYFCNPSYGENGRGVYTMTSWGDVDLFMLDDRWWRSAERIKDSMNGKPNPEKQMLGKQQLDWLKNALLYSSASFKIIAVGSQVLNPVSPYDKLLDFPAEHDELMSFLKEYKINGVLFMTGDRHHSEVIRVERPGTYPLYDVTISALTSGSYAFGGPEKNNPYRVVGVDILQNYGKISVTGPQNSRKLTVEYLGLKGEKLAEWNVMANDLKSQ